MTDVFSRSTPAGFKLKVSPEMNATTCCVVLNSLDDIPQVMTEHVYSTFAIYYGKW